jgi:hypothetical protein
MTYENPIMFEVLLSGSFALTMWSFILRRSLRSPLNWVSPVSLFSMGLLLMYIIPTIFWQFRSWKEIVPPYYEGLPLVMIGAIVLGIPFLLDSLRKRSKPVSLPSIFFYGHGRYGKLLWILIVPVFLAFALQIYMFTLGHQGRGVREELIVMGSITLASIVFELVKISSVFYFALIAFGTRFQRQVGYILLFSDGLLQLTTLHRWLILVFILRTAVFFVLMNWKINIRKSVFIGILIAFTIVVIGDAGMLILYKSKGIIAVSGPVEIGDVIIEATGKVVTGQSSSIDKIMYRLNMARSASAVMDSVPNYLPFTYGDSALHMIYAFIPRFFWPEKPSLAALHSITIKVMPDDMGISPLGTIAELYMNFNFFAVFLGGILFLFICRWLERSILSGGRTSQTWICVYPAMALWVFWADANFSQRLAKMVHIIMIFVALWLFFLIVRKTKSFKRFKSTKLIEAPGSQQTK